MHSSTQVCGLTITAEVTAVGCLLTLDLKSSPIRCCNQVLASKTFMLSLAR
jgi:hypothetical protein